MSAIQPIDVATPNRAMPVPPSAGSGAAAPGQPFADVIRSAVSPAQTVSATRPEQTPQRASYPLVASTSSRLRFHGSSITAGMKSNRADASVSPSPSQPAKGKASMQTTDLDDDNVDSSAAASSSSVDLNGAASSPVEEQAQSSILVTSVGGRSSEGTPQQALTDATQAGSLPAVNGRKQNGSAKEATKSQDASTIAATVTSIGIASVAGIVAKPAVVNLPGEHGAAASVNEPAPSKLKSVGSPAMPVNSSISNRAPAPGLTPPTPQADGFTGAAAMQPHGAGVSSDGAAANPATATKTTATSSADQNGGSDGFGGNQPASATDGVSGHASTNGFSNPSADANTSTAVSATGAVSSGAGGNNAVGSGANGTATSIHSSDGSKSGDFIASTPMPATAAKDLPAPHANPADSGVGLQASASVVSSGNHSVLPGGFSASTTASTAPRASAADAFTALDSAAAGERGVLLHAAPHQVAVGVSDPSLGWVEVRAERVSGQIAAALTTSSTASHAALTSVLPTMATYLQDHHAGVQQVHVETSLTGGQAGTGSQGQTASQPDAQTGSNDTVMASSASSGWNAVPDTRSIVPANQGTNFSYDGHHFSIRA